MKYVILILYAIFAVTGSNLMKYGGMVKNTIHIGIVDINISLLSIFGLFCYGVSFMLYFWLLNKFELSFLSSITLAIVYSMLLISAIFLFNEHVTVYKVIGFLMILLGALLIIKK